MTAGKRQKPSTQSEKSRPKQDRRGKFRPGESGNPAGRPKGAISKTNRLVREMLEQRADEVISAILDRAAETGDPGIARLVLDRLAPAPKHAPREPYALGSLDTVAACTDEMRRLAAAVAEGDIDEEHADAIAARVKDAVRLIESMEFERRIAVLEAALGD